ncbi:MAG TPA: DUF5666 domain-containing protein [Anaerolineales bacterium]
MSTQTLHDGLQASLEALARGETIDSLLARRPALAADLRPALEAAQLLSQMDSGGSSDSSMVRSRARVRAGLPSHHPTPFLPRSRIIRMIPRVAGALAAGLIAAAAGLGGLAAASANALPDSPLFPLKLVAEGLRLELTVGSQARIALQEIQSNHRVDEVRQLLAQRRLARVAFEGVLQSKAETVWHVAGITVDVPLDTYETRGIIPGMTVEVHGQTMTSGRFLAEAIHLAGFTFKAAVQSMEGTPGVWTIADRTVLVTQDTVVDPGIHIGDVVVVSVHTHDTDPLVGREILRFQVVSNSQPAAPTETARPARTQVPDGDEEEGNGRGQGSGEGEETEEPENDESGQGGNRNPDEGDSEEEEEEEQEEEEGNKKSHDQDKKSHGGGPNSGP